MVYLKHKHNWPLHLWQHLILGFLTTEQLSVHPAVKDFVLDCPFPYHLDTSILKATIVRF